MKFIYLVLFVNIIGAYGQFSERANWTFAELPTTTISQKRYKCSQKLDFSCECRAASSMYDVGSIEDIHPFCLTEEGKKHGSCTGGCIDIHQRNLLNTKIDGSIVNIEAECINVHRSWTPPVYPKCLNEKNEDVYAINGGVTCNTKEKCQTLEACKKGISCADCSTAARWNLNGVNEGETKIPGVCRMPGEELDSIVDVTSNYSTEVECLSNLTWMKPMNRVRKYYEISRATKNNDDTLTFTENDNRQCVAGDSVQDRYGISECPKSDPYCNQFPKIDRIDIDSDNYNQMLLSASFTKFGKLQRCDSRGVYDETLKQFDNQRYPLAPCPDKSVPYYCDFPQNELFGSKVNSTVNGTTTKVPLDTTCGVGLYDNKTRNSIGLPHGIREYENAFSMSAFQWSVEQEDPVSLATNMNEILTEMETVQMNIYSVGKLIDRKYILESQQEGLDETFVNEDNAFELNNFFEKLALTGDALPFAALRSEEELRKVAEWSPTDLHATGETDQLRCHSVDDSVVKEFRKITDVRKDFVEKFFANNKEQDCTYEYAALDTTNPNATKFKRCANHEKQASFLYPSVRKAFVNPVKADFFLAGFMKGSRFVKEMAQSEQQVGLINAGKRKMVDGTEVVQNATYNHIKMMFSMTTDQAENCNTVRGSCRPTYNEYPNYRFKVMANDVYRKISEGSDQDAVTSFAYCKTLCYKDNGKNGSKLCGGFMYKARNGLHQCHLVKASGNIDSNTVYTDLKKTLLADDAANHWTSTTIKRPDCKYRILNTRYVDIEVEDDGSLVDRNNHNDGINRIWGYGETINKGRQWGYHTCRTSITVKKLEKIDADHVDLGLRNDAGEKFIKNYPYTITIEDEGCENHVIEKEEVVSQATTAAVSLTEQEEMVKIHSPSPPDYCRSTNGHYSGSTIDSHLGGVCLSHKQEPRHHEAVGKPFGDVVEKDAKCLIAGVDKIGLHPNRKECTKKGGEWIEARNFIHRGRAETCYVNGTYKLHEFETKEKCTAEVGGVWTDAVPATDGLGYISKQDFSLMQDVCQVVSSLNISSKEDCEVGHSFARWVADAQKCYYPSVISSIDCDQSSSKISRAVEYKPIYSADTVPLTYEDERLTCGGLGYGAKDENGPYTSRYDRIRMVLFVDVLRLKDLYSEDKGASTIVPRGLPVGLTEGYTPLGGMKDPTYDVKLVGQHRLQISDQDVAYYNPETKKECTIKEAADPAKTGCLTFSYAAGYRASGRGETFRGRTQQERDDRNQIRKVIGEYLVRDEGIDEASPDSLGQPFWKDDLTTISFLGTATSSDLPLESVVQDIREDFGDAKIYNRYMVELFSDCKDRTKQQQHSSRLHIQTFKEGRLHGDRIRDSLPQIKAGDFNEGFPKYSFLNSTQGGHIRLPEDIGQPLNSYDLVTLHNKDGKTCADAGNYMLKSAGYEQDFEDETIYTAVAQSSQECETDMATQPTGAATADSLQACADLAGPGKNSFSFDSTATTKCIVCEGTANKITTSTRTHYKVTSSEKRTYLDSFVYKAQVVAFPTEPHTVGAELKGKTLDDANCDISLMERSCDGFSYDVKTEDLLAQVSPIHNQFQITTKDVCGPVELDLTGCTANKENLWGDEGECTEGATKITTHTNRWDCETNGYTWVQSCHYLQPCGATSPLRYPRTCVSPSNSMCRICNEDTPTCYDSTMGDLHDDGKITAKAKSVDMKCAGFNFANPNIKIGMNVRKVIDTLDDDISNLDFYDLPVEVQTYGSIFGAELVEFSVGFNILDTIDFEDEQYLLMEGMGASRTEAIAWLKNNRIAEQEAVKDVRSMGDLTYPQLTTEEVIFSVQSYNPNLDPELHNVHIETLSVCAHEQLTYFEPYIRLGKIERNVVNCIVGKVNDGRDGFGDFIKLDDGTIDPKYAVGTDACQYVYEKCPHKPMTGFTLKKEDNNYFLLADYRPLYGSSGHQFIDNTCDILSITRLMDLLTLPDFENEYDNNMVYQFAKNLPEKCTTVNGATSCVGSGDEAVKQACVAQGTDPNSNLKLLPEDFFKKLGPKGDQKPVSQTIVRNFKSMMMKEAKDLLRGVREVVPCRRLATHGDDLSPEFAETVLGGYTKGYGSLSKWGDRFEPRNCWFDGYKQTCTSVNGTDVTAQYDNSKVCETPEKISTVASVDLKPKKCEEFKLGTSTGSGALMKDVNNFVDRFSVTGSLSYTKEQCHQLCEDNLAIPERCVTEAGEQVCYSHCLWQESSGFGAVPGQGSCYFIGGTSPNIQEDASSTSFVTKCKIDSSELDTEGKGYFATNAVKSALTVDCGKDENDVVIPVCPEKAKQVCEASPSCIAFQEVPVAADDLFCNANAAFETTVSVQNKATNPDVVKSLEECMFVCKGVTLGVLGLSDTVKYVKDDQCVCMKKQVGVTCAAIPVADTTAGLNFAKTDHYNIDVTYDISSGTPTNIAVDRARKYDFFSIIDAYGIDSTSVYGQSGKFFVRPLGSCIWCKWDNTQPRTYADDSENCMTNVVQHLENSQSFEAYLDGIGPALDMEQEICVQKNNIYRSPGSKHIPCGYNNLYNFDMDSVYPPEQFLLTEEEISYRLNPKVPSWDALIFHPDDVGDIANHYEPITKNFILPIKAEIVIQGHHCHDDYDFKAADGSRRRRRMLGNRRRKRVGRKLLQADGTPTNQFGSTDGVAFSIQFNLQVTSQQPVTVDGKLVYPGDPSYPASSAEVVRSFPAAELLDASSSASTVTGKCVDDEQVLLLTVTYGSYYGIILITSLLALALDLRLNKFK